MPYRFRRRESVIAGVRRIADEEINRALSAINDHDVDSHETVHGVRQRCKKIRALLRIVRPQFEETYRKENAFFRKAAAGLSNLRDAQSMVECFDRLAKHFPKQVEKRRISSIRTQLVHRRNEFARHEGDIDKRLKHCRKQMRSARSRVKKWSLASEGFEALADGFEETYRRGHTALEAAYADPGNESFHEWRKHVKYHGYHGRLLRGVWPSVMDAYRDTADRLGDILGDDHDLAAMRAAIVNAPEDFGKERDVAAFVKLVDRRRRQLQAAARPVGTRMFIHEPHAVTQWFANCWTVWQRGKR